jgi:hypothetical protein
MDRARSQEKRYQGPLLGCMAELEAARLIALLDKQHKLSRDSVFADAHSH